MRVTVIGYVCRDRNVLPDGHTIETVGGKGFYKAAALARSGVDVDLIPWLPPDDAGLLTALADYPVSIHVIPIPTGTVNTNQHDGDTTIATTRLDPVSIEPKHFDQAMTQALTDSDVVLIAPDIEAKLSLATLHWLDAELGVSLMADISKYFRIIGNGGRLVPRYPWPRQAEYLKHFRTVFLSSEDIVPALTSGESNLSISRAMSEQGPSEVVITKGGQGAFAFQADTNDAFEIPAYPSWKLVDPTSAGDTFIGAYVARRLQSDNLFEAGRYAAMAASLKLNYTGPLRETAEEIDRALKAEEDNS